MTDKSYPNYFESDIYSHWENVETGRIKIIETEVEDDQITQYAKVQQKIYDDLTYTNIEKMLKLGGMIYAPNSLIKDSRGNKRNYFQTSALIQTNDNNKSLNHKEVQNQRYIVTNGHESTLDIMRVDNPTFFSYHIILSDNGGEKNK